MGFPVPVPPTIRTWQYSQTTLCLSPAKKNKNGPSSSRFCPSSPRPSPLQWQVFVWSPPVIGAAWGAGMCAMEGRSNAAKALTWVTSTLALCFHVLRAIPWRNKSTREVRREEEWASSSQYNESHWRKGMSGMAAGRRQCPTMTSSGSLSVALTVKATFTHYTFKPPLSL